MRGAKVDPGLFCGQVDDCYEVDAVIAGLEEGTYQVRCVAAGLLRWPDVDVELGPEARTVGTGCRFAMALHPVLAVQVLQDGRVVLSSGAVAW